MLIPDFLFNPSAGVRNDSLGNAADLSSLKGYAGIRPLWPATGIQLSLKEVVVARRKLINDPMELFLVTLVTDNQSNEPIKLRIHTYRGVSDGYRLPLPVRGLAAYQHPAENRPSFLDYRILLIEAPVGQFEPESLCEKIRNHPKFLSVRDVLTSVARVAPPTSSLIKVTTDIVLNLTARTINADEQAQLLYVRGTFDKSGDEMGVRHGMIAQGNEYASVKYQVERV